MAKTQRMFNRDRPPEAALSNRSVSQDSIDALRRAPCTGDVYARTSTLIDAVDHVAELLTGNREHFWSEPITNAHFK